ncbi:MAG TPA: hypothetical protein VHQ70_07975 [Syntrophomonadaceae bacterium]|nr:hypothetical protein [Syntrophomonadaceae bacterium]
MENTSLLLVSLVFPILPWGLGIIFDKDKEENLSGTDVVTAVLKYIPVESIEQHRMK